MALDPIKNFAKVTVSAGYDSAATSITLNSGDGNKLPDPATDGAFNLVWWNATDYPDPSDDPNVEIVRVTAKSGDTLTITRGQEGTSAVDHNTSGKTYKMVLAVTEKTISDINSTFIPYEGATQNVDLGSYGLTTNSLTIGSLSGVLKASSGVVSGGAELNDLSDVNASSPSDGQVLTWDSGTSKWIASTPSSGGFSSKCRVYLGSTQSISAATWTTVAFDTKNYDVNNEWDTTNYKFTASAAGYYLVLVSLTAGAATDQYDYEIAITKNGTSTTISRVKHYASAGYTGTIYLQDIIYLAANDYIYVRVWFQDAQDIVSNSSMNFVAIHRLS